MIKIMPNVTQTEKNWPADFLVPVGRLCEVGRGQGVSKPLGLFSTSETAKCLALAKALASAKC